MKKVFDQTVRDLKREVNKKVLKIPGIEQKILDATSNEPWGPHGSLLADIAQATRSYHEYQIIMTVIWKRINDTGKNWRHVYKGLSVLEYLVAHGSERVIDEIREHAYQISTLSDFQYVDSSGRDQGTNVRRKSQSLVALVNDKERIQEVRQKANVNKDKYHSTFSTSGMHHSSPYPGSGGYGDHHNDERYDGRYGHRDDNRNGSRDSDECYDRDGCRDDDYKGCRGDNHVGSRNRRTDGDGGCSFNEDHQHSSQNGGVRDDESSRGERQLECKYPDGSSGAPPSYEEATGEHQNYAQDERDGGAVQSPVPKAPSPPSPKASSAESVSHGQMPPETGTTLLDMNKPIDAFDEFDPRGSAPATAPAGTGSGMDIFMSAADPINSLDLMLVTADVTSEAEIPNNSDPAMNFGIVSSSSNGFDQIVDDPFGNNPFLALPQDDNSFAQQQNLPPATSFRLQTGLMGNLEAPQHIAQINFDFGDSFQVTTPNVLNGQVLSTTSQSLPPELAAPCPDIVVPGSTLPRSSPVMNGQILSTTSEILPSELTAPHPDTVSPGSILPHMGTTIEMSSHVFQSGGSANDLSHTNALSQLAPSASQAYSATNLSQTRLSASIPPQTSTYSPPQWGSAAAPPVSHSFPPNQLPQPGQSFTPSQLSQSGQPFPPNQLSQPGQSFPPNQLSQPGQSILPNQPQLGQSFPPNQLSQPGHSMTENQLSQLGQSAPVATQANPPNPLSDLGLSFSVASQVVPSSVVSQPGLPAPLASQAGPSTSPMLSQPGLSASGESQPASAATTGPPVKSKQQEEKFETKSTVWADTLSRGLVNLNISGPKINPLADIGIDFDSINRMEKRKEKEKSTSAPVSTIVMGKAMGTGSGIGRAGASGLAPPPNPMLGSGMGMGMMNIGNGGMGMGMGMGMGGGGMSQQPMGMGVGVGVGMGMGTSMTGMGMGANMGMGQGMPMQPPAGIGLPPSGPAMSGFAYNPAMMGMGGPGSYGSQQQQYGAAGGYR